jgi:hypothetical protein
MATQRIFNGTEEGMGNAGENNPKGVPNSMIWMLIVSVFGATANSLLFKASLNAFSSPVSQIDMRSALFPFRSSISFPFRHQIMDSL